MGFDVTGKVALVTGANRGIGKAIVEALLAAGAAKVHLAVRDPASTAALMQRYGDRVTTHALELSSDSALAELASATGDVALLVNNAGMAQTVTALAPQMVASLAQLMEVNVYGLIRIAQAFAGQLQANQGALVQLNSVASLRANPQFASYCASKAAAYSVTQALRKEWQAKGVQVLSVHPGPIATDMIGDLGLQGGNSPQLVAQGIIQALAAGDFHLYPDDFAKGLGAAYQGFANKVVES